MFLLIPIILQTKKNNKNIKNDHRIPELKLRFEEVGGTISKNMLKLIVQNFKNQLDHVAQVSIGDILKVAAKLKKKQKNSLFLLFWYTFNT